MDQVADMAIYENYQSGFQHHKGYGLNESLLSREYSSLSTDEELEDYSSNESVLNPPGWLFTIQQHTRPGPG